MPDFDVEMVGDTPGDIENRLSDMGLKALERTDEELMQTARNVKDDLEETSPHDTGEYEGSWYIYPANEEEVWILNSADHAPYVMLPNSRMVGSENADLPTSGVLHNVEGVAKGHQSELSRSIREVLEDLFDEFSI